MMKLRIVGLLMVFVLLTGCQRQSYKGAKRYPLSGKITYDGQIVDAGNISFLPESGEQRVSGGTITDGIYNVSEADGANAGPYKVEIRWHKKTGRQFRDASLNMMLDERKEGLPEKFHANSELKIEVSPKATHFDFDLKSP